MCNSLICLDCFRVLYLLCFGIFKCTSCLNWPVCYSLCTSGKNVQFTQLSRLPPNATSSVLRNVSKKKKKKSAFECYIFCASEHKRVKERKCTSCLNWPVCYSLCASGKNVQFTHLPELLPNATSAVLRNLQKKKKKLLSNATSSVLRSMKQWKKENAPVI